MILFRSYFQEHRLVLLTIINIRKEVNTLDTDYEEEDDYEWENDDYWDV